MEKKIKAKKMFQKMWDFIGIPFRLILFDQKWLKYFRWTSLEEERINFVKKYIKGELLDIGAGENNLVKQYGSGIGIDIYDWGGGAIIIKNTSKLSFSNNYFDTITFIASFNHIPYRAEVLKEVYRVLNDTGRLIITMINPILGYIGHHIWWYGEEKKRGGMKDGEVFGLWSRDIILLCKNSGFILTCHKKFVYGMNNLYIFKKEIKK